ncbi:substrate-binding domain-containing protein [Clostridium sp.]|uniref:substrate-binding domain-containing protein n=1 Tax=Clostridium sp. TaxID=1506 RepID=UPI003F4CAB39
MKKMNIKTLTTILCISIVMLNTGCKKEAQVEVKKSKSIKIICEESVSPMVNDLARDYNLNNETVVVVEILDRDSAFTKINNSEVDILVGYVQPADEKIESEILAYDGIGIIVNVSNKVKSVGTQELKKIYTGNMVNWVDLKGESQTIIPVAFKNPLSLVQQQFNISIMDTPVKEEMSSDIKYVSSMEEMKNFVAQNKNAIGIIPGQWYNKDNVFLKLSGIELTLSNLANKLYALNFPIKVYYSKEKKDSLDDFLNYIKSEDGIKIVRKHCIEAS